MSTLRSLKRNVAKERMKLMGFNHVNKRLVYLWRDLSAPNYLERLKNKQKKKTKEEK